MVSAKDTHYECSWLCSNRHLALVNCWLHVCCTCEVCYTVGMFLTAWVFDGTYRRRLRGAASFVLLLTCHHNVEACVLTTSAHFHPQMLEWKFDSTLESFFRSAPHTQMRLRIVRTQRNCTLSSFKILFGQLVSSLATYQCQFPFT
jgi:hypothetical protein